MAVTYMKVLTNIFENVCTNNVMVRQSGDALKVPLYPANQCSCINHTYLLVVTPGYKCAACYQEDNLWYRAEVLELLPPSNVLVQYSDFGNKEWLNCKRYTVQ